MLVLGVAWYFFPTDGLTIGGLSLRFPSYAEDIRPAQAEVDVDAVLSKVNQSFEMTVSDNLLDSMRFFRNYLKENPNRIYLPNDDYTFFDPLFAQLEAAQEQGKTYRIMHYGDSQIEMDRISSVLREKLQEHFGGSGPNMIPAIQPVATISVSQRASGLSRYMVYGEANRAVRASGGQRQHLVHANLAFTSLCQSQGNLHRLGAAGQEQRRLHGHLELRQPQG